MADDYTPSFKHAHRSQRQDENKDGRFRHVVIVEYLGGDRRQVIDTLRADLEFRAFKVDGPAEPETPLG